jgi:hypothetical protein
MVLDRASMLGAIRAPGFFLARTRWCGVNELCCTDTNTGCLSNPSRGFEPSSDLRDKFRPARSGRRGKSEVCTVGSFLDP